MQPAGLFGGGLGFGDDRRDALTDEAHHIVENIGVVGIDQMILVHRGAVEPARNVLPGEDRDARPARQASLAVDARRMRAWACGERSTLRCSSPSIATSIV